MGLVVFADSILWRSAQALALENLWGPPCNMQATNAHPAWKEGSVTRHWLSGFDRHRGLLNPAQTSGDKIQHHERQDFTRIECLAQPSNRVGVPLVGKRLQKGLGASGPLTASSSVPANMASPGVVLCWKCYVSAVVSSGNACNVRERLLWVDHLHPGGVKPGCVMLVTRHLER